MSTEDAAPDAPEEADAPAEAEAPAGPDAPAPADDFASRAPRPPVETHWFDDEAGPVVRLFSMTRGRTRPADEGLFDLISLITAAEPDPDRGPAPDLDPEHHTLLSLCRSEPLSVAELGSYTDLPVSVVRVLLGDLHEAALISVTRPVPFSGLPDERLLRDVINGLRAL